MRETKFTCEKCRKSWMTNDDECPQSVSLAFRVACGAIRPSTAPHASNTMAIEVCRPCYDEFAIPISPQPSATPKQKETYQEQVCSKFEEILEILEVKFEE